MAIQIVGVGAHSPRLDERTICYRNCFQSREQSRFLLGFGMGAWVKEPIGFPVDEDEHWMEEGPCVESCELGTSKMESPKAIPQGEGERERTESTVRMNKGKPTHFDVAVNTKKLHLDLFYRCVGISPALVASFV